MDDLLRPDPIPLPLATGDRAVGPYRRGVDLLLAGRSGAAVAAFAEAVALDPGFALGYAGLAVANDDNGGEPGTTAHAITQARRRTRGISRRERQHVAIVDQALTGHLARASGLAREHLLEFPGDVMVLHVVARRCGDLDDIAAS